MVVVCMRGPFDPVEEDGGHHHHPSIIVSDMIWAPLCRVLGRVPPYWGKNMSCLVLVNLLLSGALVQLQRQLAVVFNGGMNVPRGAIALYMYHTRSLTGTTEGSSATLSESPSPDTILQLT